MPEGFGWCPVCGAPGNYRDPLNGNDTCERHHKYRSRDALQHHSYMNRRARYRIKVVPKETPDADGVWIEPEEDAFARLTFAQAARVYEKQIGPGNFAVRIQKRGKKRHLPIIA